MEELRERIPCFALPPPLMPLPTSHVFSSPLAPPPASSPTRAVMMDVFLDIQLMAKGDYFLHGASSVAEAVIYTNIGLHERSVHLEYRHNHSRDAPWLESAGVRRAEDRRRQF